MGNRVIYPVDRSSFKGIREDGLLYVDKTGYIYRMLENKGKFYFLARPRRFGKSMFLDTLAEYFKGNKELFNGLEIESLQPGEWEKYPVLRFNLSGKAYENPDSLRNHLHAQLRNNEGTLGLDSCEAGYDERFETLIRNACRKFGKNVIVLIDEYDAPLSSAIGKPELQEIYREQLHGFYSVLKAIEDSIGFCMLTGVTRYGKVSVFSGLNNLNDITFHNDYAGICGITREELRQYYAEGAANLAQKQGITVDDAFGLLKFHYDGYHFSECMLDIYNPFSINYAMYNNSIKDYWCQSGLPTILSKTLLQNDFDVESLNGKKVSESTLRNLSMYTADPVPLFYQTGYLTLKAYDPRQQRYTLGYPNREVESGILNNVLSVYVPRNDDTRGFVYDMEDAFEEGNPELAVKTLKSFLSGIPLDLREDVKRYENYYHTIFYCIAKLIGLDIEAEYATSEGYIDILIKTTGYIYIIELKVNGTAEEAMRQIEKRHYAAPFDSDPRKLFKIGLGFSKVTGTIDTSLIE